MIIPYFNYEIIIPRKMFFCFFSMVLYLIIAMPDTNRYVGSHIYLYKYDDISKNDRYYLWFIQPHEQPYTTRNYMLVLYLTHKFS